jgi:hypothetical protein
MARYLLLALAALAVFPCPLVRAQAPDSPLAAALADLAPGPPLAPARADLPGCYFEPDPLLDRPDLPPPGWFGELEAVVLSPHVRYWSNLKGPVVLPGGARDTVQVPGAHLPWTASPLVLLGYGLPAGFGELTAGFRYFASDGAETLPGPDGPSSVRSRLDVTLADFDYRSAEISLWHCGLDMRWWAGGRFSNLYFDSRQGTAPALAAAGTGVTDRRVTNRFVGFGPHAGLELAYFLHGREWSLAGRVEAADMLGRIRQTFSETTLGGGGASAFSSSQDVPMITAQFGLRWQPDPATELFFGYQYEHYWNAGRMNIPNDTMAEVYAHGVVLRARRSF